MNSESWVGTKIRKGQKEGQVTYDDNPGRFRTLGVTFQDETKEKIVLNNVGADFESVHEFEWWWEEKKEWVKF